MTGSGRQALYNLVGMAKKISVRFHHGLGDCINFAHLVVLYIQQGYEVEVECNPSAAPVFLAAGATLTNRAEHDHPWEHPWQHDPELPPPNHFNHWSGSKVLWNISRPPLPDIGHYSNHWAACSALRFDLESQVTAEVRSEVDQYLRHLPRPLVCIHTKGNTGQHLKNLDDETTRQLYVELLAETDATLILLDWDDRVARLPSYRVRHLLDDWKRLSLLEFYYLLTRVDLLIGVDSGPLHLLRLTDTLGLGVWDHLFPSHYALPRAETLNVVPSSWHEWSKHRRVPFSIVEGPGDRPCAAFIALQAARLLQSGRFVSPAAADVQLQDWLDRCNCVCEVEGSVSYYRDRQRSFGLALEFLNGRSSPTVVETGCIRAEDDWTAGFSTYLLSAYLFRHGGLLHSVDMSQRNVEFARAWTANFAGVVRVHRSHSHDWLQAFEGPIDLFYTDSADVGNAGFEECCLREVELVLPKMRTGGQILVDDTVYSGRQWRGKGALAVPMLLERGYRLVYSGYQCLLQAYG